MRRHFVLRRKRCGRKCRFERRGFWRCIYLGIPRRLRNWKRSRRNCRFRWYSTRRMRLGAAVTASTLEDLERRKYSVFRLRSWWWRAKADWLRRAMLGWLKDCARREIMETRGITIRKFWE